MPAVEDRPAADRGRRMQDSLAPLLLCVAAGLTIALTPVLVWRFETGDWVCLDDWYSPYYMRFAAQAYYHHLSYVADVVLPGRATTYQWLPFVPAIYAAHALGAGPFAVNIVWIFASALGLSVSLYYVFRRFLGRPWIAAGATIFCLSDYGFAGGRPLVQQLRILADGLWRRPAGSLVDIPWGLLLQWRVPDPGLNIPLMCLQIVAVARARARPTRLNLTLSGLAFGLLFYVFFYCWTMAMAGLGIAFVLDRSARRVYGLTLCTGVIVGLPQLIYSIHLKTMLLPEAVNRFGLFTPVSRFYEPHVPLATLSIAAATGWWIWKAGRADLVYLWSLAGGEILLRRSAIITGLFFHEYHYDWNWISIRVVLVIIVAVTIAVARIKPRPAAIAICWTVLAFFFAAGVYIAAIAVTRSWAGVRELANYRQYAAQRRAISAAPLAAGATIAGDDAFCELAAVVEDQWVLDGHAVARSLVVSNEEWEARTALNAYLMGMNRADFERAARAAAEEWFWENPRRKEEIGAALMDKYDEIARDPGRFIDEFRVRYVALAAGREPPVNLGAGWTILQPGPYWQIWQRQNAVPSTPRPGEVQ